VVGAKISITLKTPSNDQQGFFNVLDGLAEDEENSGLFRVHIHLEDSECFR
jgi:hypothetical protein